MNYEELKAHYGVYKNPAKPHTFTLRNTLFMWQWGTSCWDSITIKEECNTQWIWLGKVRNLKGAQIYQLVLWRFMLTWGSIK